MARKHREQDDTLEQGTVSANSGNIESPSADVAEGKKESTNSDASKDTSNSLTEGVEERSMEMAPNEGTDNDNSSGEDSTQRSLLVEIAERVLKEHQLSEVHVTSDGQAFYVRMDAHNHARNLQDDTIISLTDDSQVNN